MGLSRQEYNFKVGMGLICGKKGMRGESEAVFYF